ncbi:MAG: hypothetical protein MJ246_05645 [Clostridia bacterium]|nr:hypothetical protein [Clostridia bacterium]
MKKISTFILSLILVLSLSVCVSASSAVYRFTHNDHDCLIVGTITSIDETKIKADVSSTIVSTEYLNVIDKRIQLNPQKVTIDISNHSFGFELEAGDHIVASLDKTLLDWTIANGIYKVNSLDPSILKIEAEPKTPEMIAIEYFINSNGSINNFAFEEDKVLFEDGNGDTVEIFSKGDEGYYETVILSETSDKQQALAKNYDDAMVVAILLTAGIMIVIVLIKSRKKTND